MPQNNAIDYTLHFINFLFINFFLLTNYEEIYFFFQVAPRSFSAIGGGKFCVGGR